MKTSQDLIYVIDSEVGLAELKLESTCEELRSIRFPIH